MGLTDRRIGLLFAVFLSLLGVAAAKASWLGVVRHAKLEQAAATQQTETLVIPARRGAITDVHGVELAVSQPATTVVANPRQVTDAPRTAARLAPLLERDEDTLLRKLAQGDTGFVYLARRVPAGRARKVEKLGIEGVQFIPEFRRTYPRDWLASQVIGTVGGEGQGLAGLEYRLDRELRGRAGERRLVKDALGEAIELREPKPARPGATVKLTLDAAIQDRAEAVLAEIGREWKPAGATALVMDPRDGSILALANWPQVNANNPGEAPDYARQNRAVAGNYEPGSTFKAFTVAGALEDGKITPRTEFFLPPTITVADREIRESHPRPAVTYTTTEILEKSSNVGAVKIGLLQKEGGRFDYWVRRFGFGKPTGVDLPGEERGLLLPLDKYSGSTMGNLPIGQGLAVTAMQMGTAYAAIANGGILRPPHIVASVGGRPRPAPRGKRVISQQTAKSVSRMLEGVLGPGGTASGADIQGYVLAGKTGTAQKPDLVNGGYSDTKYVASFVGFAPARDPRLLVAVMVDEPRGEIYGGLIAAPAFKQIMGFALNYLRIPPR